MPEQLKLRILFVDDELSIRAVTSLVLTKAGYEVSTAEDGFDALSKLRRSPAPDAIISDLNMPQMSGFEFLSVVRRRFPNIPVIAMSGAYASGDHIPGGVIADAFFVKGASPKEFLRTLATLLQRAAAKAISHDGQSAPVWIPRNGKDSKGVPYVLLTCTECLRSFPVSVLHEAVQDIQETPCFFCTRPVRYIIDFSRDVSSPRHDITAEMVSEPAKSTKP